MLVVGRLLLSFIPGIPKITLNPDVVFFVILPPLLYNAAWLTSWREFSYHLVSICFLAFGLVTFTVLGVTQAGQWIIPGFDWRVGLILGAVVAPDVALATEPAGGAVGPMEVVASALDDLAVSAGLFIRFEQIHGSCNCARYCQ